MSNNRKADGVFAFSGLLGLMSGYGSNVYQGQYEDTNSHQGSQGPQNDWMQKGTFSIGNSDLRESEIDLDRHSEFRLTKSVRSNKSDGSLNDKEINQAISHKLMFIQHTHLAEVQ